MPELPSQTGHAGHILFTDGTNPFWESKDYIYTPPNNEELVLLLHANPPTYGNNTLTGGIVGCDSYSNPYTADRAIDGNANTEYISANASFPHYWEYDLGIGVYKIITKLTLQTEYGQQGVWCKDFILKGSNDHSTWTNIYSGQQANNEDVQTYVFANTIGYRYLRIYVTDNWDTGLPNILSFREIGMFEWAGGGLVDSSDGNHSVCASGDAEISTSQYVFGGGSFHFNGTGKLIIPQNNDFDFGSGDFTIKERVRFDVDDGTAHSVWDNYDSVGNSGGLGIAYTFASHTWHIYSDLWNIFVISWTPAISTSYATELSRRDNMLYFLIDGVLQNTMNIGSSPIANSLNPLLIGARKQGSIPYNCFHKGYIDEIAVWKGIAKEIMDYTPETVEFTTES